MKVCKAVRSDLKVEWKSLGIGHFGDLYATQLKTHRLLHRTTLSFYLDPFHRPGGGLHSHER